MTDWRVARSLLVLLAEVNATYPKRDKRTDGTISGYPGAISSHNPNSAGVVCALDITTGLYPGGITPAQGITLADKIRVAQRDQPRGKYAYVIHNRRIAHGDIGWTWASYTGPDPHTSHIHVSVDWDLPAGGAPSGQADYDSTLPWGITKTAPLGTIEKDDDMSAQDVKAINAYTADLLLYGFTSGGGKKPGVWQVVVENQRRINTVNAKLAALESVVGQLAKGQGVTIDYARIDAGVKAALADGITIDGTITAGGAQ